MDVVALSPVVASRLVWRRGEGRWALTLVVKATFDVVPGEVRPSGQLAPVYGADVHEGGQTSHPLIAPNDLVPFKARADVLLVGHAYAPHGRPASVLTARLAIGGVDKSIVVHGNRVLSPRGVGPALPFAKMPLSYDRASGGPGTSNPIGVPRGERLPNLEPLGWSAGQRGDVAPPVGFGPLAPSWPERAARQRPWRADEPLPDDFDAGFFNAAPADQQAAFLRGDEAIVLEHLHPDHATLATRLPGLVPRAFVDRHRAGPSPVEMIADTVWIDTDRRKLCVVWRGEAPLAGRDEPGRVLVAMTNAREPVSYEQMSELHRALSSTGAGGIVNEDTEGDEDAEEELRSTNAVPAVRLPGIQRVTAQPQPAAASRTEAVSPAPSGWNTGRFEDDDSGDDLPSHIDPIGTSTRAYAIPDGTRIPDAAPAWLATPSRQDAAPPWLAAPSHQVAAAPQRQPTLPSHAAPLPHPENAPPLDLVWDAPESGEPRTMPPPELAEALAPLPQTADFPRAAEPAGPHEERAPGTRTGPLPVIAPAEPASPWALGLEPGSAGATVAPVPLPSAVVVRSEAPAAEARPERRRTYRVPNEAVDLVWFDPAAVARIAARFRDLVDELDMEPLDPAHDLPVDDPAAARDRHHVFGVLTRAPLTEPRGVPAAFRSATDAHGRFTPPLVVVEGDLVLGLEEREVLKTTAACAKPLAKDNKRLQDVLAGIDEVLETPLLLGAAGTSDSLLREVLSAVSQSKRAVPGKVLEEHVERLLLSQRAYQLRVVLGGPQIRAALVPVRDALALVSYLPESVGPKLPLSLRFRARLVAEVHPSPDPQESSPLALRVVAIGRVVAVPGRG
jgi:hypothetical protein